MSRHESSYPWWCDSCAVVFWPTGKRTHHDEHDPPIVRLVPEGDREARIERVRQVINELCHCGSDGHTGFAEEVLDAAYGSSE